VSPGLPVLDRQNAKYSPGKQTRDPRSERAKTYIKGNLRRLGAGCRSERQAGFEV